MTGPIRSILAFTLTTIVVGALVGLVVGDRASEPYVVSRSALSGWTLVKGEPGDPWVVAARPPAALTTSLFQQLSHKARAPLVAPERADLPLVLRTEFDDALQGMWGVEDILRVAREGGLESTAFDPVCVAHRVRTDDPAGGEFFFVAFTSPEFRRVRADLTPDFAEHAGIGYYDAALLTPALPIAATDAAFARWWPLGFDALNDCEAKVSSR